MRTNVAFQQKSGLHHFLLAFSSAKKKKLIKKIKNLRINTILDLKKNSK